MGHMSPLSARVLLHPPAAQRWRTGRLLQPAQPVGMVRAPPPLATHPDQRTNAQTSPSQAAQPSSNQPQDATQRANPRTGILAPDTIGGPATMTPDLLPPTRPTSPDGASAGASSRSNQTRGARTFWIPLSSSHFAEGVFGMSRAPGVAWRWLSAAHPAEYLICP